MKSKVSVTRTDSFSGEICSLDDRYGKKREHFSRKVAEEMARMDDLIEKAGIKPGDRFEVLVKTFVRNEAGTGKEEKHVWTPREAVFLEIDNGRFRVKGLPGSKYENDSWAICEPTDIWVVDVRKI